MGSQPIVELLIEYKADVTAKTLALKTAQKCASEAGQYAMAQFWRRLRHERKNFSSLPSEMVIACDSIAPVVQIRPGEFAVVSRDSQSAPKRGH